MNDGFKVGNGLKERNGLALGLFIIALECVANNTSGITVKWTISYKALQLIGCADDIKIMGRTKIAIYEAYEELREQKKWGSTSMSKKEMVGNRKTGRRRNEILKVIMTVKLPGVLST
jgi:hypothetical protein